MLWQCLHLRLRRSRPRRLRITLLRLRLPLSCLRLWLLRLLQRLPLIRSRHLLALPCDHATPSATQRQPDSAAKKKSDQAEKRKRESGESELERSQNKRVKQLTQEPPPPTGSGRDVDLAGNKRDSAEALFAIMQEALKIPPLPEGVGLDCFQFVMRAEKYITSDMSGDYNDVVERTAMLTPTERAALVASLAHMIQEDQAKTMRLLKHSVIVAQHFAKQVAE